MSNQIEEIVDNSEELQRPDSPEMHPIEKGHQLYLNKYAILLEEMK